MSTLAIPVPPLLASPAQASRPPWRLRRRYVVLLMFLFLVLAAVNGVMGFFRLSSDSRALRGGIMDAVPGQWDKKIAVNVGPFTLGTARLASLFIKIPPEPRAAIASVRGAEVGIYELKAMSAPLETGAVFAAADKKMSRRGWVRLVGVVKDGDFVAVYCPREAGNPRNLSFAVAVLHETQLVIASVRGNAEPLVKLARAEIEKHHTRTQSEPGAPAKISG